MERDLYGIRPQSEDLRDLPRLQVRAITHGDEFALARVEGRDRRVKIDSAYDFLLEITGGRDICVIRHRVPRPHHRLQLTTGDPDQPGDGVAFRRLVATAITKCALEYVARDVLGVRAVADPVGDVRVDATDQLLWLREWISAKNGYLPSSKSVSPCTTLQSRG